MFTSSNPVRRARVPDVRRQRRRHHRLPGVPVRAERHQPRQARAEAQVGLLDVRPGRQRVHLPAGDARDRDRECPPGLRLGFELLKVFFFLGNLQDGWVGDEDAGGREHTGEADGQDLPPDGSQQGRQAEPGGVHRGRQE